MNIKIISASVRTGRKSHRVALFFNRYITNNNLATVEILDLAVYKFPLFDERLQYMKEPSAAIRDFQQKIISADGIIIVTPEYNGGYPASLKNVVDLLYPEWKKKPIAVATVSDGPFGGTQVITSILFSLWKIGAWVVPAMFPVPKVREHYDEEGNPVDAETVEKRAKTFVGELIWSIEAKKKMEQ
jgi:NAD(P)H-dependent FMN reductase